MTDEVNTPPIVRREGGKFAPGRSANPSGRPKGIASKRPMTDAIWRAIGRVARERNITLEQVLDNIAYRAVERADNGDKHALSWIADRIEGKARPTPVEKGGEEPEDSILDKIRALMDGTSALERARTDGDE